MITITINSNEIAKRSRSSRAFFVVGALLLMPLVSHSATQKELDKARADGDVPALAAIAADAASEEGVRVGAIEALPVEELPDWIDSDFYRKSALARYMVLQRMRLGAQLPLERYAENVRACIAVRDGFQAWSAQSAYVTELMAQKKLPLALGEARRLLGMCPVENGSLMATVNLIARCIRAESFEREKSVSKSLAAFNSYLEGIEKKDVSGHPFMQMAYPAFSEGEGVEVEKLEKGADVLVSYLALLYSGKYKAARGKAEIMFGAATIPYDVQLAVVRMAATLIGEAGVPEAGNSVLGEQAPAAAQATPALKPKAKSKPKAKAPVGGEEAKA